MSLSQPFRLAFRWLGLFALIATISLNNYPFLLSCQFPAPDAQFRLLALADPQLEGDTSLPSWRAASFPAWNAFWSYDPSDYSKGFLTERPSFADTIRDTFATDLPIFVRYWRKKLDLYGNDMYLAHVYATMTTKLNPTHVTVLGDLLGSQWISDEEFERRSWRFWNRVFAGAVRVDDELVNAGKGEINNSAWNNSLINVAGNHDIGYAGDITVERVARFERQYGKVNWDFRFSLPNSTSTPELRLVILNSMNIDNPAHDTSIQSETFTFLNQKLVSEARPVEDATAAVVLLTHIPLHKKGLCADEPLFTYHDHGVREQNMLSQDSSVAILEGVFGLKSSVERGRPGIILNGHDHVGCQAYHYRSADGEPAWAARRWKEAKSLYSNQSTPGVREVTVRSMMGSYGGNAGLVSGFFNETTQTWSFDYSRCPAGVQHIWWAVYVFDAITALVLLLTVLLAVSENMANRTLRRIKPVETEKSVESKDTATTTGSEPVANAVRRRG